MAEIYNRTLVATKAAMLLIPQSARVLAKNNQRYLELTAKRASDIAFTIPRGRRWWQSRSY